MAKHRLKCTNAQCRFEGMMDATAERSFVKKHFLDMKKKATATMPAAPEQLRVRCPKCGARWRVRATQLH